MNITDRQTDERAIGDCVLAKIGLDNAHCNDKYICINMDDTIFENQLGFTQWVVMLRFIHL